MAAEDAAQDTKPEPSAKADISLGKGHLSIIMYSRPEYITEFQRNEGKIHQHGEFPNHHRIQLHMKPHISPMLKARIGVKAFKN